MAKKNNNIVVSAHPGIDPGLLVPKFDTLTSRPRHQVIRGSKTVHIGQTIRVSAIFVFAYKVKTSKCFTLLTSPVTFICIWY